MIDSERKNSYANRRDNFLETGWVSIELFPRLVKSNTLSLDHYIEFDYARSLSYLLAGNICSDRRLRGYATTAVDRDGTLGKIATRRPRNGTLSSLYPL